jgi:hypothetical protein
MAVLADGPDGGRTGFDQGARDALRWLVKGGPGPLTGAVDRARIAATAVVRELAAAQDIMYGPPSPWRDYAAGLEQALMWACHATAAPPTRPPAVHRSGVPVTRQG